MSVLKRVALVITVLLLALVGAAAWMLRSRAEEIPAELPPTDVDPMSIVIPGGGGLPDLRLADHKGKTLYLILGDRESMQARESKEFDRALNRWTYPPDVVGFAIGDAEGFKLLAGKIEEMLGAMRPEMRLPLYIDFDGTITKAFKLPKGHTGIVVLGPDGALKLRHSGPPKPKDQILTPEDDIIARLKLALRAEEPALQPAPPFKVGELDNAACAGKTCLFVFLGAPVKKSELPGVDGGFDGGMEDSMKQLQNPSIRLAGLVNDLEEKLAANDKDQPEGPRQQGPHDARRQPRGRRAQALADPPDDPRGPRRLHHPRGRGRAGHHRPGRQPRTARARRRADVQARPHQRAAGHRPRRPQRVATGPTAPRRAQLLYLRRKFMATNALINARLRCKQKPREREPPSLRS